MYSIGDKIMYGGTGVCVVEQITSMKMSSADQPRDYYVLRPLYQSGTIQIPVDNVKVPIRPIMTRSEAETLVDGIPDIAACQPESSPPGRSSGLVNTLLARASRTFGQGYV